MTAVFIPYNDSDYNPELDYDGEYCDLCEGAALEERFIDFVMSTYGDWLQENNIVDYTISVRITQYKDFSYKLFPYIKFKNESDAAAFKLRWL